MSHREQCGQQEHHSDCCSEHASSDIDRTIRVWQDAFEHASHEVRVEILKQKIRKSWGLRMGPIADAVIALMRSEWKTTRGAKSDDKERNKLLKGLVDNIRAAYKKGPKK